MLNKRKLLNSLRHDRCDVGLRVLATADWAAKSNDSRLNWPTFAMSLNPKSGGMPFNRPRLIRWLPSLFVTGNG